MFVTNLNYKINRMLLCKFELVKSQMSLPSLYLNEYKTINNTFNHP
jgi:hypothetical protein